MSQAPHVVRGARWGLRLGPAPLEDLLWEALKDPQCGLSMAETLSQCRIQMTIRRRPRKYIRMGEIAYMAEKEHEAFTFMADSSTRHTELHVPPICEYLAVPNGQPVDVWSSASLYRKALMTFNSLLSLLSLLGVLYARRARHAGCGPYGMVLLIFPLVFYLTHSSPRYRFPMDHIILILAASTLARLISFAKFGASRKANVAVRIPPFPAG